MATLYCALHVWGDRPGEHQTKAGDIVSVRINEMFVGDMMRTRLFIVAITDVPDAIAEVVKHKLLESDYDADHNQVRFRTRRCFGRMPPNRDHVPDHVKNVWGVPPGIWRKFEDYFDAEVEQPLEDIPEVPWSLARQYFCISETGEACDPVELES